MITLTTGAAEVIRQRWGRHAHVLPHPHVLAPERIRRPRRNDDRFVIGVDVKSLRANMDSLPVLDTLTDVVSALPDAIVQTNMHDEIFDPENYWYASETGRALLRYRRHRHVDVRVHPVFLRRRRCLAVLVKPTDCRPSDGHDEIKDR